mgnify:CR=1 FL=1
MIRESIKTLGPFVKGIVGAILGGVVLILALHAYQDHQALHALAAFINQHAEKITKLP